MSSDKNPKKQKLPWGIEKPKPGSSKKITESKLEAFSVGFNKKTPFQRQQEEAALRKKKEEEEAAKVYAEFVESFDEDVSKPRAWVKGGTIVPKALYEPEDSGPRKEPAKSLYRPQPFVRAGAPAFVKAGAVPSSVPKPMSHSAQEEREVPVPKAQRKRNLDMFLEELKKEQEERDQRLKAKQAMLAGASRDYTTDSGLTLRAAFEDRPGSHDTGDPTTTNLYVGNINPAVDEGLLCREFAQYGPIASVKIMWPRTNEEKERNRNCGFVSFMTREAAATALRNLDGKELLGNVLRVGWGKAVAIPAKPIYGREKDAAPPSGLPFNAQLSRTPSGAGAIPPPRSLGTGQIAGPIPKARLEVRVSYPGDQETAMTIHRFVERVIRHGPAFEALIMEREKANPSFQFLYKNDSVEHIYYRWKLYSMLQGDSKSKWRAEPFQMFDDGMIWIPPEIPFDDDFEGDDVFESSDESEASQSDSESRPDIPQKGPLLRKHRLRLEHMLRKLNLERGLLGKIMVFCIDHAHAADEIIDVITKSLLIAATPIFPVKMARLYLLSDILHNSGTPVPNAWKYRSGFERCLEEIFAHLGVVRRGIERKLRQEQMKRAVMNLLDVWDNWIVFPAEFVEQLRQKFLEEKREDGDDGLKSRLRAQESEGAGVWALDEEKERDESARNKWNVIGTDDKNEVQSPAQNQEKKPIAFAIGKQEESQVKGARSRAFPDLLSKQVQGAGTTDAMEVDAGRENSDEDEIEDIFA